MRSPVRMLHDQVINQIAAGEVVERPASVVKELLENALDAGAGTIAITLREGGKELVRVADDGCGMAREDAIMCLERHATSKITSVDDLFDVGTLGFRGEALPSIASVSRFTLVTRPAADEVGTRIQVDGGTVASVRDAGCAAGTQIDVKELFYNLPARRKFLRTTPTELSHALETVVREALIRPDVDFTVRHGGRQLLRSPAVEDWSKRARELLGEDLAPVVREESGMAIRALIAPAGVHRGSAAAAQYLYVNGRFVKDPVVRRGVSEAYRELVPRGRYAVVVLDLQVGPGAVDVNVHPSKTEVRFRSPGDVVGLVTTALREALRTPGARTRAPERLPSSLPFAPATPLFSEPMVSAGPEQPRSADRPPAVQAPAPRPRPEQPALAAHPDDGEVSARPPPASLPPVPVSRPAEVPAPVEVKPTRMRLVGSVGRWLICEDQSSIVFVDADAAGAALKAARLREEGPGEVKRLLTPRLVELGRHAAAALDLEALGEWMSAEPLGPDAVAVRALCEAARGIDLEAWLRRLCQGQDVIEALAAEAPLSLPPDALLASLQESALPVRAFQLDAEGIEGLEPW